MPPIRPNIDEVNVAVGKPNEGVFVMLVPSARSSRLMRFPDPNALDQGHIDIDETRSEEIALARSSRACPAAGALNVDCRVFGLKNHLNPFTSCT